MNMNIIDLKTEYRTQPMGLDAAQPRFSWKIRSENRNVIQKRYRILAASQPLENELLWDSSRVESSQSQHIRWKGPELSSRQRVYWKVQIETESDAGREQAESPWTFFEMGLLQQSDWQGKWIEPAHQDDYMNFQPAPYLRRKFTVQGKLRKARIYQTAHGLYEYWLNGTLGTEDKFKPGLTSYHHRLQYQVYDVTNLLREGENVWAVALGDGWWRGKMAGTSRNNFGYRLQFLGQLELTYEDGRMEIIASDECFRTAYGGIRKCDMRDGETFDWSLEPELWRMPGFDDSTWEPVQLSREQSLDALIASRSVPVREFETFRAKSFRDANGDLILDFGQNLAGYVRMTLRGCKKGQEIVLTHGEDLKDGVFSQSNLLGGMFQQDRFQVIRYNARGEAEEHYCPTFAVFGFRYVKVEGYEGEILPEDFTAVAVYSALEETGDFTCSNGLVNQLVRNSRWSQKGNFLDVPTDCPTRERSAWTGDSQVYCRTAADFMNVYPFFEKWMQEFPCEQFKSGKLRSTVPTAGQNEAENERAKQEFFANIKGREDKLTPEEMMVLGSYMDESGESAVASGSSGWSDAAVINPWTMYLCYGDKQILENQYPSMQRHVDYMFAKAKNHNPYREGEPEYHHETDGELDADYIWDTEFHWGEWLEADIGTAGEMANMMQRFVNPDPEVPTTFLYYSTKLLSQIAGELGHGADAAEYSRRAEKVKTMFNRYLIPENGQIKPGRQAPNVRTLAFDLCDDAHRSAVVEALVQNIRDSGMHLNTGFLSTCYLLDVLTDAGYPDLAFVLLEQEGAPSWLYNVKKGATTILEEWCGMDSHVGSFNHYSYGAVCNFLFSRVAGIRPLWETPGYQRFVVEPVLGGSLNHAEADYESLYGTIRSAWKKGEGEISYHVEIPANTTAELIMTAEGTELAQVQKQYPQACWQEGKIRIPLGSGLWDVTIGKASLQV